MSLISKTYDKLPKAKFWGTVLILAIIVSTEIYMTTQIPVWRTEFYNIMEQKQQALFAGILVKFIGMMFFLGAAQGLKVWVGTLVSFQIRVAASKLLLKTWVYANKKVKNYSQAMTESLRYSTELFLEILVELTISGAIVVMLIVNNWHKPDILVAALAYTVVVTIVAHMFQKPLISKDMQWQQAEGEYREAIVDISNGNGDFSSKRKFLTLVDSYKKYTKTIMFFTLFTQVKASVSNLVPFLMLSAPYFAGSITFGEFMGGTSTFELIVINSTILVLLYTKLTKAKSAYRITKEFWQNLK